MSLSIALRGLRSGNFVLSELKKLHMRKRKVVFRSHLSELHSLM